MNEIWDRLGISASILCIIHCLATPFLIVMLPFASEHLTHGYFHWIIAAIVVPVAVLALWKGYLLHRMKKVLWLGAIGITLVCLALYFAEVSLNYEITLMVIGGACLAYAHYTNLRHCQTCEHHHH